MIKKLLLCAVLLLSSFGLSHAKTITITDIAGREVTVNLPVKRIILGEGRYISLLGLFDRDNPVKRVVGMPNDLQLGYPKFRNMLAKKYPEFNKIELFGMRSADSISSEKILTLAPDLAIFGIHDHGPGTKNKELLAQLKASGTKVVFIDFRLNPFKNTIPSLKLLAKILEQEKNGNEYIEFYQNKLDHIAGVLAKKSPPKPTVFLQAHVGRFACCVGMANGMLGPYLKFVGGVNISAAIAPGPVARHTMEFLLSKNPDVWIGTASGTLTDYTKGKPMIVLGPGSSKKIAQSSLQRALSKVSMQNLKAVKTGRAHGIWHNFYNSPLNIVAVESFAKWVHPSLFSDLDPHKTMVEIYDRFLPFELDGVYGVTLQEKN